jgi:lysophospholipase L1-like esterase
MRRLTGGAFDRVCTISVVSMYRAGNLHRAILGIGLLASFVLPNLYRGNQLGPRVGMVGDSLTCLSASDLQDDFQSTYGYDIACKNGITITQGAQLAGDVDHSLEGSPSVMIVNLGTNDALKAKHDIGPHNSVDGAAATQALNDLAYELGNVPCVLWVTVSEVPDVYGSHVAAGINSWIHARTADPHNFMVDWWGQLRTDGNATNWLSPVDGIHTTVAGQAALASMYLHAVQSDCALGRGHR